MHRLTLIRDFRCMCIAGLIACCVLGCSTPVKMTSNDLASIGVIDGTIYWEAEQKLAVEGYQCSVTGAKRENFDCTKMTGFFVTCLLRVEFVAEDKNLVSKIRIAEPACMGTP